MESKFEKRRNVMNILYSGDANIADGVILSTLSLTHHVKEPLNIYVLTASLDYGEKRMIALESDFSEFLQKQLRIIKSDVTLTHIDISESFARQIPSSNMETRFTPGCMLRLFADEVDALPPKILYLDSDVICRGDIGQFYNLQMGKCSLAGVLDYYGGWFFKQKLYKRDYLNSGVLLLNLAQIRKNGLFARAREMCVTKKMFMPDQSALNKLCKDKIICERRYNEQRKLKSDTVLQHFTTSFRFFPYFHSVSVKPWNVEGMHEILKLHEYDGLIEEYQQVKNIYLKEKNK